MEIVDLVKECLPYVFSILATIVAFIKGKPKKTKSVEQIKATADKKYARYVDKQLKKNKIENVLIETTNLDEVEL